MNYKEKKKEEVKEKKKSFFSQAQIESIRKSEEEMKNKEETIKVKAVEVKEVQKAVYVADNGNHRIQKFTSQGEFITKWGREGSGDGEFEGIEGRIAIDSQGNVYVTDSGGNDRLQKFTSQGEFITKWGRGGSGDGEFGGPFEIAILKI